MSEKQQVSVRYRGVGLNNDMSKFFELWLESQVVVSYSGKPIATYIPQPLAVKINNFHLPGWQNDPDFLNRVKWFIDNSGDEYLASRPQELEKAVIKAAMDVAHAKMNARVKQDKEDNPNLDTNVDEYERCWVGDKFGRIVCGKEADVSRGMEAFKIDDYLRDPELKGYFGVHIGNPDDWLDWLVDDGYCSGDIYIYEIVVPEDPPFYLAEDKNSGGFAGEFADKQVPEGQILFSQLSVIPASQIKLDSMIKERDYWKERKRRERQGY